MCSGLFFLFLLDLRERVREKVGGERERKRKRRGERERKERVLTSLKRTAVFVYICPSSRVPPPPSLPLNPVGLHVNIRIFLAFARFLSTFFF